MNPAPGHAVVIAGEAPESDDEGAGNYENPPVGSSQERRPTNLPNAGSLKSQQPASGLLLLQRKPSSPPQFRFDSLLHRMLRETWGGLIKNLENFTAKVLGSLSFDCNDIKSSARSSQTTLQDTSYKIRIVAENLYKIDDQLDAILSCQLPMMCNIDQFPTIGKWCSAEGTAAST